jgi:hypothetical protein
MTLVKLEKSRTVAVGLSHVFDAVAASGRKAVWEVQLLGDFCNRQFARWMVDSVYSNWCESQWGRYFVSKDLGRRVPDVGVD